MDIKERARIIIVAVTRSRRAFDGSAKKTETIIRSKFTGLSKERSFFFYNPDYHSSLFYCFLEPTISIISIGFPVSLSFGLTVNFGWLIIEYSFSVRVYIHVIWALLSAFPSRFSPPLRSIKLCSYVTLRVRLFYAKYIR